MTSRERVLKALEPPNARPGPHRFRRVPDGDSQAGVRGPDQASGTAGRNRDPRSGAAVGQAERGRAGAVSRGHALRPGPRSRELRWDDSPEPAQRQALARPDGRVRRRLVHARRRRPLHGHLAPSPRERDHLGLGRLSLAGRLRRKPIHRRPRAGPEAPQGDPLCPGHRDRGRRVRVLLVSPRTGAVVHGHGGEPRLLRRPARPHAGVLDGLHDRLHGPGRRPRRRGHDRRRPHRPARALVLAGVLSQGRETPPEEARAAHQIADRARRSGITPAAVASSTSPICSTTAWTS